MTKHTRKFFYECGCCGQYHRALFNGDCREDAERLNYEDFPEGWQEVTQDDADKILRSAS